MNKAKPITAPTLFPNEQVQHLRNRQDGTHFEVRLRSDGFIVLDNQTHEYFLLPADAAGVMTFVKERRALFKASKRPTPKGH